MSGGMVDYLQYPPTSHEQVAELSRGMEANRRWQPESEADSWYGAARMQPIFLDGISVAFPELKIIGAHLGYGLYDRRPRSPAGAATSSSTSPAAPSCADT